MFDARPCRSIHADPATHAGDGVSRGACRACWLALHDGRYRRVARMPTPPIVGALVPSRMVPPGATAAPACRHLGPETTPVERKSLGLTPTTNWRTCAKGYGVDRGGQHYVCPCFRTPSGCKTCPAFEAPPVPPPAPKSIRWSYGVTTVADFRKDVPSRRKVLLPRTLASLAAAGFDRPHLFVDGADDGSSWAAEFGLPVTCRGTLVRVAANWHLALWELYHRDPRADRYAVFQDDLAAYRHLRAYLDAVAWPAGAYLNLYTCPENHAKADGRKGWFPTTQNGRGALALCFTREAAMALLGSPHLVRRVQDEHRGWRAIDGGVVEAMKGLGYAEHCHNPSLVQHTGTTSAMDKRKRATAHEPGFPLFHYGVEQLAPAWRGETFDARQLLG